MFDHNVVWQYQEEGGGLVPGTYGATSNIMCYNCKMYDHVSYNCPDPDLRQGHRGYIFVHVCVSIIQQYHQVEGVIYSNWILIYTCSTLSVCSNRWLLQDINNAKDMRYYTLWKIADHINMIWLEQSRPFQSMHTTTQIHLQILFYLKMFHIFQQSE